ncbi:hypothetical protein WICPIJ_009671 [Wickerhamomyces pijperi]|uniref:CCDC43 PWI-like domain-containing protein n=1 Tax=Wickerhamomyces pijperi TaxID=599730 RepID=A0A9P8TCS0_WICPI|nr:hypothetical protein WICPIJ_009671 [Wickerhamomyces pijperi]
MVKADPNDTTQFKSWLFNKCKIYSEADSDMLSDYIIALLELDSTPDEHIANLKEQLSEFTDNANAFSNEIVSCLVDKSYVANPGPSDEQRQNELAAKQRILQKIQERKLAKQREEEMKIKLEEEVRAKIEHEKLVAQEQRKLAEQQRLEEEHIRLQKEQEERQKQFEIKQQKKTEMIQSLEKMIELKEKMLDEYDSKLFYLQQRLLANPEDLAFQEEAKLAFTLLRDEMITNHVTPEDITQDKFKLEKTTNSTSMLSTRGLSISATRPRGVSRGGIHKQPFTRNPNTSYNKKLDLRTRTICMDKLDQGKIHKILEQLDMDKIECTKNDADSGFNVTFKDRFHAEQAIKNGIHLNGSPLVLRWNELIRPGLGSLNQSQ